MSEPRDHRGLIEQPIRERFVCYANPGQEFELAMKAYYLRLRLASYSDQFDVHVSDDTRHGAMCKVCKKLLHGTREDFFQIEREMLDHECKGEKR